MTKETKAGNINFLQLRKINELKNQNGYLPWYVITRATKQIPSTLQELIQLEGWKSYNSL